MTRDEKLEKAKAVPGNMAKHVRYERKGARIRRVYKDRSDKRCVQNFPFESINEAKRESRRIQLHVDGALGRGTVSKTEE